MQNNKVYLIDYENVNSQGLEGYKDLSPEDEIVIFYSQHADKIDIRVIHNLLLKNVNFNFISVCSEEPNALDNELIRYIGTIIKAGCDKDLVIISNDKDYQMCVTLLKELNFSVSQQTNISNIGLEKYCNTNLDKSIISLSYENYFVTLNKYIDTEEITHINTIKLIDNIKKINTQDKSIEQFKSILKSSIGQCINKNTLSIKERKSLIDKVHKITLSFLTKKARA